MGYWVLYYIVFSTFLKEIGIKSVYLHKIWVEAVYTGLWKYGRRSFFHTILRYIFRLKTNKIVFLSQICCLNRWLADLKFISNFPNGLHKPQMIWKSEKRIRTASMCTDKVVQYTALLKYIITLYCRFSPPILVESIIQLQSKFRFTIWFHLKPTHFSIIRRIETILLLNYHQLSNL